jgi:FkbM family methyltransferase
VRKIRIAFVKFGGLSSGGTERWLQMMAANLPKKEFDIDYYYCDAAPYIGTEYKHANTDPMRLAYMRDHDVNMIKFHVQAKDVRLPTHDWVGSDFWNIFDCNKYDFVQTAKAGPPEYPYYKLNLPVIEFVALGVGVDTSQNIACSIHLSQWQRARWCGLGGELSKSKVISIPANKPSTFENLRIHLGIPENAIVAGFHQRNDDAIYSQIPLTAFSKLVNDNRHFIIMGGGQSYVDQAKILNLKNIHFLPHSGDDVKISLFLNTLDIFAHGRKDGETFGTVFAEAMMHGKPCLSHRSNIANAQPETMGPGGLFADDEIDYKQKLDLLFSKSDLREMLGNKGKEHAIEHYSMNTCVGKLSSIYKQIAPNTVDELMSIVGVEDIPYGVTDIGFLLAGEVSKTDNISYCVVTGGCPKEFCIYVMRYFFPRIKSFVDVGVDIGLYCWLAAYEGNDEIQIHLYRPQKKSIKFLKKTIKLNNWEKKVHIHNCTLENKVDVGQLHLSSSGPILDNGFNDNSPSPTEEILIDTLDNQKAFFTDLRVDFLRINVEDFEFEMLNGAKEIIIKDLPIIFMEISDKVRGRGYQNKNYTKTLEFISSYDYIIMRVNEATLNLEIVNLANDNGYDQIAMYLCLPKLVWIESSKDLRIYVDQFRVKKFREKQIRLLNFVKRKVKFLVNLTPKLANKILVLKAFLRKR